MKNGARRDRRMPERAGRRDDIRHWRGHSQRGAAGKKHSQRALCAARVWPRRARAAAKPRPFAPRPNGGGEQKRRWQRRWARGFRALCGYRRRPCARKAARPILRFRASLPGLCGKRALRRTFPSRTRAALPRLLWCWSRRPGPPHTQWRKQNDNTRADKTG